MWIPGHSGIERNEIADSLAKNGALEPLIGAEPRLKVSPSHFKSLIYKWKNKSFKKHWNDINHARQSKNCISINAKNTKYLLSLSKSNIRRMTAILTGHCPLNKHLNTIGITQNDSCSKCGESETAEHFLCKCPAYITARAKCIGAYILPHNII